MKKAFVYSSVDDIKPIVSTICNDEVLNSYDKFEGLIKKYIEHMESSSEYEGFPKNPIEYFELSLKLFEKGSDTEKRLMFGYLNSMFGAALQHWKADKDELYPDSDKPTPFFIG